MILVLPLCSKDGELALKNLRWIQELDPTIPFDCLISHDDATSPALCAEMLQLAKSIFKSVTVNFYPAPEKKYWPAAPNCAFQNAARYIAHFHKGRHWMFLEADATPIRPGWLQAIEDEYIRGGKPIMGHVVDGLGHPNGVAVYPSDVAAFSQDAMRVEETAWDVVIGATVEKENIHNAGIGEYQGRPSVHLIQHCWNMAPDGTCTNGHGISPTFTSVQDVVRKVDLTAAIFHRCKDGSLIHWLREFRKAPHKAMVPDHTSHEQNRPENRGDGDVRGTVSESDSELPKEHGAIERMDSASNRADSGTPEIVHAAFTGKCEIFIVTYGLPTKRVSGAVVSDFDWLAWCLRAIRRHCTGFSGITLAIPGRDAAMLQPIANEHAQAKGGIPLRIKMFNEKPGKGMLMHMAVMASADEFIKDATHVLHVDADVIFKESITPSEYIHGEKPVYVWRSYESLAEVRDGQKVVSDCVQWKAPTEAQLGFEVSEYTMVRHPTAFPMGFYKPYREHIEKHHGKPFLEYMVSGRNEFPQNRLDFTAMGSWAHKFMPGAFDWLDISGGNHLAPRDKQQCFWSHSGINPTIQKELESLIA